MYNLSHEYGYGCGEPGSQRRGWEMKRRGKFDLEEQPCDYESRKLAEEI